MLIKIMMTMDGDEYGDVDDDDDADAKADTDEQIEIHALLQFQFKMITDDGKSGMPPFSLLLCSLISMNSVCTYVHLYMPLLLEEIFMSVCICGKVMFRYV